MAQLLRTVRSFVRRQGRLSQTRKEAIDTLWQRFGLTCESNYFDFNTIFNRKASRILEIGFGMGHALITQAQQKPDYDFIGIDVHKPGVGAVLNAIETNHLNNIRLFCADAVDVLMRCIPDNSFDEVQLFFPDPWPKRRHQKRRLVQPVFVALIAKKLKDKGKFCLATDWEDYAKHMMAVMSTAPDFINAAGEQHFASRHAERPLTKFEQRGKNLGHGVWDLMFIKK